jgi:hypothetical protein
LTVSTLEARALEPTRVRSTRVRDVAVPVVAVGAVNLALYLLGRAIGATFTYTQDGTKMHVDAASVLIMSIIPLAVGLAIVAVVSTRWRSAITIAKVIVATLAVATIGGMTIPAGFDRSSTILLSLMHLVIIPGAFSSLARLGRSTASKPGFRV